MLDLEVTMYMLLSVYSMTWWTHAMLTVLVKGPLQVQNLKDGRKVGNGERGTETVDAL